MSETEITDELWLCVDCNKDCKEDDRDYYMVENHIWEQYGVGEKMLCMDCIEARIGHPLTKSEIMICIVTIHMNPYTKKILLS